MEMTNNHIEYLLERLNSLQVIKNCLKLRVSLINQNYALLNEYERNEKTILRLETNKKITLIEHEIDQLMSEFQFEFRSFIEEKENEPEG